MKERMISRGDLFYYDFGDRVGSVQSGERPVLTLHTSCLTEPLTLKQAVRFIGRYMTD